MSIIDEIRARWATASPVQFTAASKRLARYWQEAPDVAELFDTDATVAAMAHAPSDVAFLLAEIARLAAAIDAVTAAHATWCATGTSRVEPLDGAVAAAGKAREAMR